MGRAGGETTGVQAAFGTIYRVSPFGHVGAQCEESKEGGGGGHDDSLGLATSV